MLNKDNLDTLTRVERTEYESGNRQRSETEWKFGMDILPLKTPSWAADRRKPAARIQKRTSTGASRYRWMVPTQYNNQQ